MRNEAKVANSKNIGSCTLDVEKGYSSQDGFKIFGYFQAKDIVQTQEKYLQCMKPTGTSIAIGGGRAVQILAATYPFRYQKAMEMALTLVNEIRRDCHVS